MQSKTDEMDFTMFSRTTRQTNNRQIAHSRFQIINQIQNKEYYYENTCLYRRHIFDV